MTVNPNDFSPRRGRARIAIVSTGGTISAVAGHGSKTMGYQAGNVTAEALIATLPGIGSVAEIYVEPLFQIDSAHLQLPQWLQLADRINALVAEPDVDGIVILHGTDTLEETAYFLHLTTASEKPVVLTGAIRPASAWSADGPMNLYRAVVTAADPAVSGLGTLAVLGDELRAARGLRKKDNTPAAFHNGAYGRLGIVQGNTVFLYQRPVRARGGLQLPEALADVRIVYAAAGQSEQCIAQAADHAEGLIVAGFGNGNLPPCWLSALQSAQKRGLVVVRATHAADGTVVHNGDIPDNQYGFISGDNLSPQQARVLLMLGLAQPEGAERLQWLFDHY